VGTIVESTASIQKVAALDAYIVVADYVSVANRAAELGCELSSGITILPENFEQVGNSAQLLHRSEAATVKSLFRQNQIPLATLMPSSGQSGYVQNNGFEWVGPTLFISAGFLSGNPNAASIAINVLSNYITDFFKGLSGSQRVKLEIVVEKKSGGVSHSMVRLKR
jgi:hypothetical protein